jgi:transcription elongation factor GreA
MNRINEDKKLYVTAEGLKKIQNELSELKQVKRKEISERIQDAKELGDLSENAEYQEAKEEQGFIESRIMELEQMLKNAEVIKHRKNTKVVLIGSKICVSDIKGNDLTYTIVGSSEADPMKSLISNESPIGKAFLNREVGDSVVVQTPGGEQSYTIKSVE